MAKASYRYQKVYKGVGIDLTGSTKRELEEKVRKRKDEIDKQGIAHESNTKMRLGEWADIWLETYYKISVKHYTYTLARGYIDNYIKPELGRFKINDILPIDIQTFLNNHADKKMSFMSHLRSILNCMMDQAVLNRIILINPIAAVRAPKCESGSHRDITDNERRLLLDACKGKPDRAIFLTMLYLGCSPQEAKALKVEDVNIKAHTVEIKNAIVSKTTKSGDTKTEYRVRPIPITDEFYNTLIDALPSEGIIFRTQVKLLKSGEYYKGGKTLSEKALASRWRAVKSDMQAMMDIESAQTKTPRITLASDFTMYCLRHTYATDLMSAGVPLFIAKNLMGHKDTRMLEQIYGHRRPDQLASAKDLLDKYHATKSGTKSGTKNADSQ